MSLLLKSSLLALLALLLTLVPVGAHWIVAPRRIVENQDYTTYDSIAIIRSDKENYTTIRYSLRGQGCDEPPYGVFSVEEKTGYVKIHQILDREKFSNYTLKGVAKYLDGSRAEDDLDLLIKVNDENDCPPVIAMQQVGYVRESSAAGTVVMKVKATDDDEPNQPASAIYYRIDQSSNAAGMFYIDSSSGEIFVQQNKLDREKQDTYKLTIIASDLNGSPRGNSGTGVIEIKLLDINDNIPTLEKESYEGSITENTVGMEIMRIKAVDMDLVNTDNWLAAFEIVSGNEGGYVSITTDAVTNEGVITVVKALDYEELKALNLAVRVSNKAEYNFGASSSAGSSSSSSSSKTYPVTINVQNVKEGPRFQPSVKVVTVSEEAGSSMNQVIATYTAIDSDTLQTATNVRYAKFSDKDNWISIDEKTAEIRLNKAPDRESLFLINGTYYAKILCITNDAPSQTATGTIAIQVEDFNDHCPQLTSTSQTLCYNDNAIFVTAEDKDEFPNSAPFEFTVISESKDQTWTVEPLNGTSVILRDQAHLWPGIYKVAVQVKDQQGKSCDDLQTIDLTVCTCLQGSRTCDARNSKSVVFGAAGVLLMLLGLLLLLLLPLLMLFCLCGSAAMDFKAIPFETKEHLMQYSTEGQGEDKGIPYVQVPVETGDIQLNAKDINTFGGQGYLQGGGSALGGGLNMSTLSAENRRLYSQYGQSFVHDQTDFMSSGMTGQEMGFSSYRGGAFDGIALSDRFLEEYYVTKFNDASQQFQVKDQSLIYDYEGRGSLAGSVGCCSLLEKENDLSFLDDLGPKFRTLAEICQGSTLVTESVDAGVSIPPIRSASPVRPPASSHEHIHTHTEMVRDHVDSFRTSNVTSGSSTMAQEERFTERVQSSAPKVQVQENIVIPNQTLYIQQPALYYTATPMYVVEPNPQMVLVSGGTQQAMGQMSQVGFSQGMMQVGSIQGSQGVVLVDGQLGAGGATGQVAQGGSQEALSRSQTTSMSQQVLMAENGSSRGGLGTQAVQGLVQTGRGSAEAGFQFRSAGMQEKTFSIGSRGSAGSNEDFALTAMPKVQGRQRVVTQHKKISVTERNID
ncbi:desmoglein-2 [Oryzias latipes]|uniref:Desmoglein 2 n=1 Tax=Oryzias latipes TaxID=8090 RepID=H2MRM9_ORYLA|nr:desmoglein-2 [Oryzias latipes]